MRATETSFNLNIQFLTVNEQTNDRQKTKIIIHTHSQTSNNNNRNSLLVGQRKFHSHEYKTVNSISVIRVHSNKRQQQNDRVFF